MSKYNVESIKEIPIQEVLEDFYESRARARVTIYGVRSEMKRHLLVESIQTQILVRFWRWQPWRKRYNSSTTLGSH